MFSSFIIEKNGKKISSQFSSLAELPCMNSPCSPNYQPSWLMEDKLGKIRKSFQVPLAAYKRFHISKSHISRVSAKHGFCGFWRCFKVLNGKTNASDDFNIYKKKLIATVARWKVLKRKFLLTRWTKQSSENCEFLLKCQRSCTMSDWGFAFFMQVFASRICEQLAL